MLAESSYWIFSRALVAHLPPAASGFWMVGIGMAQLAILARGQLDWRVLARHRWFFVTVGLLVGVATLLYALHSAVVKRWGGQMPFLEVCVIVVSASGRGLLGGAR
jgi:hypothetical protein